MRIPFALALILAASACGGASISPDAGLASSDAASGNGAADAGDAQQDPTIVAWLDEHNAVRSSARPAPSPALPPLEWSAPAAGVAAAWAAGCEFNHNAGRGSYGENIAAATNELTPASVVAMWADEAQDYDYATNGCSAVCGHYTQLVWRDTTAVGCAIQRCTTGSPFGSGTWYFAVCDYSPPGNYVGQKPY